MKLDAKDVQILRELQTDARQSNLQLAERVNLSPSPCLRRVRLLEEAGVITGYTALVDAKACGLGLTAFVRIRLSQHDADHVRTFEAQVAECDEILDCFLVTGEADYLLRVMVADVEAYEDFVRHRLHSIGGIGSITTTFVYGTIKAGPVLPSFPQRDTRR